MIRGSRKDETVLQSLKIVLLNDRYVVELNEDLQVFSNELVDKINDELSVL